MDEAIRDIRRFNRTFAQRLDLLNDKYLGRDRPYAESRLLHEIGAEGAAVRDLRRRLDVDSGYLSRLLRSLERRKLVTTHPSAADRRIRIASPTRTGKAELRRIDMLSDRLAGSMLAPLSPAQRQRLLAAMGELERLLRASSVEIARADPADADARHCLERYFAELARRFPGGFDPYAGGPPDPGEFVAPQGSLLLARLHGEAIGCAALRTLRPGLGEIKRMWISPDMRGLGVARRLLAELERVARRRRMRAIRLDTNDSLDEALRLYRTSGYREIPRFNDNPYAQRWFEKRLR